MIARVVKCRHKDENDISQTNERGKRAERSQFRDQRSRLHLREFAKNSRIFAAFAPAQIELHDFSSLVNQLLRPRLARDELIPPSTKGDPRL